jgi:hypothetical protein
MSNNNHDHNNPRRPQQLEQLEQARKQWKESEWRLHFLRTQTGHTLPEPTDEQLIQWMQQCQTQ